ncbi:MAG TPA: metal-dependent hydrolase [Bacteroidia bacterium]|nr:metal-dependent hydrolase [Bacteroidia bacterium]
MPSAFSHAIAAITLGNLIKRNPLFKMIFLGSVCSAIPDLDAIGYHWGIPYDSLWGHRGITHSFFFAAVLACTVLLFFYRNEKPAIRNRICVFTYFFFATASHPLLDMLTNGGLGVALFAPFSNDRFFFPFRPVKVSPISVGDFFSSRGWIVFKSEFIWIWIPCILVLFISSLTGNRRKNEKNPTH